VGVAPAHQGQGIGRALVAWGLERADHEGVAVSVVSAAGKERFYVQCGFEDVVGNVTEGEGNPLAGVRGGDILFRDRKEVREVKELKKAADVTATDDVATVKETKTEVDNTNS
jgi:GNAT superfamily N-acetyltransferase